jgi:hypothetical protein
MDFLKSKKESYVCQGNFVPLLTPPAATRVRVGMGEVSFTKGVKSGKISDRRGIESGRGS